jgi:glycogen synthase
MKILMFGWEFPPHNSGGLGTACFGLTKALTNLDVEITLVLPTAEEGKVNENLLIKNSNFKIIRVDSIIKPYMTEKEYSSYKEHGKKGSLYGKTLLEEVKRYAKSAEHIAQEEEFDIIHCHDWLTYEAGIVAKELTRKPLVAHVHSIEFDRTGGLGANREVYEIERRGIEAADAIITVSGYTMTKVIENYGAPAEKIHVVHNAVEKETPPQQEFPIKKHHKIVLFLGRVTLQKGPDYFVYAAKKVLEIEPNTRFVMAGSGDMQQFIINKAADLGIADKILFTGFLRGESVHRIYQMADVYVMPSVSEPFGITALEAINNKTPVIVSKNAGVSEVIRNCLKVDFWDVNKLANKIVGVLRYKELSGTMTEEGLRELERITWDSSAKKCINIYNRLLEKRKVVVH